MSQHRERIDIPDAQGGAPRVVHVEDAMPWERGAEAPARGLWAACRIVMQADYILVPHEPGQEVDASATASFIDWNATMRERTRLAGLGYGIAEAMDTAQRFQVGWTVAEELMRRTAELQLPQGFIGGAMADNRTQVLTLEDLAEAVIEEARRIEELGGQVIILPLLWLAENNCNEDQFVATYRRIIESLDQPVLLHWLGEMFHPGLKGYFPGRSFERICAMGSENVLGVKLSLLEPEREVALRRALSERDQVVLTGDDWHFGALIAGGGAAERTGGEAYGKDWQILSQRFPQGDWSHGLLGVLDAVALPMAHGLNALQAGDMESYWRHAAPCEALGRHLFEAPTSGYKAGLAFLNWLAGHQDNPMLFAREDRLRSRAHLIEAFVLAADARIFPDAGVAASRFRGWLALPEGTL